MSRSSPRTPAPPLAWIAAVALLMPGAVGCGADSPAEDDAWAWQTQRIVNGTRAPRAASLDAGERLAIAYFHLTDSPGVAWCTGTMITPRRLLTARHCLEQYPPGQVAVSFGPQPSESYGSIALAGGRFFPHPDLDIAVVELPQAATDLVPGLRPLVVNREPLGEAVLGERFDVAGHGRTNTDEVGLFFALVRISELRDDQVVVDGEGQEGLCFGDSGGPLIVTRASDFRPVVLAVESGGESSCVGRDVMVRTDAVAEWIEEKAGSGAFDGTDDEACGVLDGVGVCLGDVLQYCADGAFESLDCAADGQVCALVDLVVGFDCIDAPDKAGTPARAVRFNGTSGCAASIVGSSSGWGQGGASGLLWLLLGAFGSRLSARWRRAGSSAP